MTVTHVQEDDLISNYRVIAETRGWSMEQMADHVQASDPALAAQLREQAVADRDTEPQERHAAPKQDAAPKGRDKKAVASEAPAEA